MTRHPFLLLTAWLALGLPVAAVAHDDATPVPAATAKQAETRAALRDLWVGHVFWVRNVVDARFHGDAAAAKTAESQVVENARAIAGAVSPFYGEAASNKLFELLAGHWGAIKGYLDATHAGDTAKADAAFGDLVKNANGIAAFLAGANPNWPEDTLKSLLMAHGSHHVQQIRQLKAKQYDAEAKTWAAMVAHMYVIADALADGLAKQFPDRFR